MNKFFSFSQRLTDTSVSSAAASQHSCFTSYSECYGAKGFLKTTKIAW
jgi:hypothetical protein